MKDNFGRGGWSAKKKIMNRRRTPFQFDPYEKKKRMMTAVTTATKPHPQPSPSILGYTKATSYACPPIGTGGAGPPS